MDTILDTLVKRQQEQMAGDTIDAVKDIDPTALVESSESHGGGTLWDVKPPDPALMAVLSPQPTARSTASKASRATRGSRYSRMSRASSRRSVRSERSTRSGVASRGDTRQNLLRTTTKSAALRATGAVGPVRCARCLDLCPRDTVGVCVRVHVRAVAGDVSRAKQPLLQPATCSSPRWLHVAVRLTHLRASVPALYCSPLRLTPMPAAVRRPSTLAAPYRARRLAAVAPTSLPRGRSPTTPCLTSNAALRSLWPKPPPRSKLSMRSSNRSAKR